MLYMSCDMWGGGDERPFDVMWGLWGLRPKHVKNKRKCKQIKKGFYLFFFTQQSSFRSWWYKNNYLCKVLIHNNVKMHLTLECTIPMVERRGKEEEKEMKGADSLLGENSILEQYFRYHFSFLLLAIWFPLPWWNYFLPNISLLTHSIRIIHAKNVRQTITCQLCSCGFTKVVVAIK